MRSVVVTLAALLTLTACTSSEPASTEPTFGGGGGTASTIAPDDLAAAKAQAGIDDCPDVDGTATGDEALPDLTLDCLGGGTPVTLSALAGTPTVINLWASWCVPCRKELPLLARADQQYGDRVRVIGIDYKDQDPDRAIELARDSGVTYPLLVDVDETVKAALKVVGLPQTVFVDARGRMVATERTAYRSYADLTAAIERHLGVSP